MDFSKLKNKFLIVLCITVLILPFYLITFTYAVEDVEYYTIANIVAKTNSNIFTSESNTVLNYFFAEKGKKYTITLLQDISINRIVVCSSDTPALNGTYEILYTNLQNAGDSFVFSPLNDTYISISNGLPAGYFTITSEYLNNQSNTIESLVDNVGVSQFWNIFDISVNYIVIVVLVAFGLFIIFKLIKRVSKGKQGF